MMPVPFDTKPTDPLVPNAAPSPFERLFDPDNKGTLTGGMGRLFGVPTSVERQSAMEAAVFGKLSGFLETAGTPQKAITSFIQTPEGQSLMSRPGGVETLEKWTKTITPPDPKGINTPAGSTSTIFQGGQNIGSVSALPDAAQTHNALIKRLSTLTPEQLDQITVNTLNPHETQQQAIHLANLVRTGKISQEDADAFGAKVYQIVEGQNDLGEKNGLRALIDIARKKSYSINPGSDPNAPPGVVLPSQLPGAPAHNIPQSAIQPDGAINTGSLSDRKYMGFGVGVLPAGVALLGNAVRQVNPGNNEPQSQAFNVRRQQIGQLDAALTALGSAQSGRLKVQTDVLRSNVPSVVSNPLDAYNKLAELHDRMQSLKATEAQTYRNNNLPKKSRQESFETIQLIDNVLSSMPNRPEIDQMRKDITVGTSPAMTPAGAGRAVFDLGKDAVRSTGQALDELRRPGGLQQPQPGTQPMPQSQRGTGPRQGMEPPQAEPMASMSTPQQIQTMDVNGIKRLGNPATLSPEIRDAALARLKAIKSGAGLGPRGIAH